MASSVGLLLPEGAWRSTAFAACAEAAPAAAESDAAVVWLAMAVAAVLSASTLSPGALVDPDSEAAVRVAACVDEGAAGRVSSARADAGRASAVDAPRADALSASRLRVVVARSAWREALVTRSAGRISSVCRERWGSAAGRCMTWALPCRSSARGRSRWRSFSSRCCSARRSAMRCVISSKPPGRMSAISVRKDSDDAASRPALAGVLDALSCSSTDFPEETGERVPREDSVFMRCRALPDPAEPESGLC